MKPAHSRLLLGAIGFVQGVVVWLLVRQWPADPAAQAWSSALVVLVVTASVVLQFARSGREGFHLEATALALATVFALVTLWVAWQLPDRGAGFSGDDYRTFTWSVAWFVALYVLVPFVQAAEESGRLRFPYPALCRHSWNNFFIGFVAQTFVGVFWALIGLWAGLFRLLGIAIFSDLFFSRPFAIVSTSTLFGVGVAIGRESEQITSTLRRITLAQFHALMPIMVAIALLFAVTLPFTGLELLWSTRHAAEILFCLIGLTALFINAVVQDGEGEPPYVPWFRRCIEAMLLVTPVFCAVLLHALRLRIGQHGLTPDRFYGVVFACVVSLYAAGYAAAALRRGDRWLAMLRPVNVAMALVVAAVAILLHTPVLDPLAWSARAQVARLLRGEISPDQFDYAFLRGKLGRAGDAALAQLATLERHMNSGAIRERAALARTGASAREGERALTALTQDDVVLVGTADLPPELVAALGRFRGTSFDECKRRRVCVVFPVDLVDGDAAEMEYCLVGPYNDVHCYEHRGASWQPLTVQQYNPVRVANPADLLAVVRESGGEAVPAPVRDLRIGERMFHVSR